MKTTNTTTETFQEAIDAGIKFALENSDKLRTTGEYWSTIKINNWNNKRIYFNYTMGRNGKWTRNCSHYINIPNLKIVQQDKGFVDAGNRGKVEDFCTEVVNFLKETVYFTRLKREEAIKNVLEN